MKLSKKQVENLRACCYYIRVLKGKRKTESEEFVFEESKSYLNLLDSGICSISSMEDVADVDLRYQIQYANIPLSKRGNLSKYAGKHVGIILTHIQYNSRRINYFIFECED